MCVNCEKKMLNIYRQGKTFTDQFYVDEDYNVPDTKADIREIIESDAVMEEIDLKLVENYIRITGRLVFKFYMLQITVTIPYLLWKGKFHLRKCIM